METEIILNTKKLSVGYHSKKGNIAIASDIDLSFKKGTLIAMIGANGIGKSTLLRTITGVQKPLSGNIYLYGKDIAQYSALDLAKHLSLVLTEKLPPSNLTVFELIALGRQPYTNWLGKLTPNDIHMVQQAMHVTQTIHYSDKKHYEISDGQLQKVLVARALAQDTPLIVLDEPTTHLDLQHKLTLLQLLKKLAHETGKCILFSTHDIDMAIQLSDQMVLMTADSVIQDTPANFIANNTFETLFSNDDISFDAKKVKFVFKNL